MTRPLDVLSPRRFVISGSAYQFATGRTWPAKPLGVFPRKVPEVVLHCIHFATGYRRVGGLVVENSLVVVWTVSGSGNGWVSHGSAV